VWNENQSLTAPELGTARDYRVIRLLVIPRFACKCSIEQQKLLCWMWRAKQQRAQAGQVILSGPRLATKSSVRVFAHSYSKVILQECPNFLHQLHVPHSVLQHPWYEDTRNAGYNTVTELLWDWKRQILSWTLRVLTAKLYPVMHIVFPVFMSVTKFAQPNIMVQYHYFRLSSTSSHTWLNSGFGRNAMYWKIVLYFPK
jgi:hypothetical protein